MLVANDAAGGMGSISQSLLWIATQGLPRVIDGELSKKYPLGSMTTNYTKLADGTVVPITQPQKPIGTTSFFSSPGGIIAVGLGVLLIGGVIYAAVRH